MRALAFAITLMLVWTVPSAAQDDIETLKAEVEAEKPQILLLEQRVQHLEDERQRATTAVALSPTKPTNVSVGNIPVVAPDMDLSRSNTNSKVETDWHGSPSV